MSAGRFAVDLAELDDTVALLARGEDTLEAELADVRRQVAGLHADFEGLTAEAHASAQTEWEGGFAQMQEALADLRAAARIAHDNYRAAVEANLSMWGAM